MNLNRIDESDFLIIIEFFLLVTQFLRKVREGVGLY